MKIEEIRADLFCYTCKCDTIHEIIYFGGKIETITCQKCHRKVGIDYEKLPKIYKAGFLDRVLTKPHRMSEEMQGDLSHFLKTMPKRMFTKPKRVSEEIKKIDDISHREG